MNISKKEIRQAVQVLKACLHHPDAADAIAMLQGLLAQPKGEPVGILKVWSDGSYSCGVKDCPDEDIPEGVYFIGNTHPAPITAEDVTPKMMVECNNNLASGISTAEFAAAVNAYLGSKK